MPKSKVHDVSVMVTLTVTGPTTYGEAVQVVENAVNVRPDPRISNADVASVRIVRQ